MKPTILICALLALPLSSHAADDIADKPAAPVAPPALEQGHAADDGHDHGATAGKEDGPTDALWRESDVAFHDGDYPRAVELHREIVKLDPTDSESYGVGAWLLWSLDKKAEANAFIAQGLKNNPDDAEMWNVAAQQYGLEKEFVLERDAYVKAVKFGGRGGRSDVAAALRSRLRKRGRPEKQRENMARLSGRFSQ